MITKTEFKDKNDILGYENLQKETGFERLNDGTYLVSVTCPMPGITPEMIEWWFWWHPQAKERYRMWFPGEHISIYFGKKDKEYFSAETLPEFKPNSQYPVERIGGAAMPLRIDFTCPEEFGFDRKTMNCNNIPLIVCGHVGVLNGLIWHTEMAHIFKQTDSGLFLISRFWIGETLKNPFFRKLVLTDKTAKSMLEHCHREYRNLADLLPEVYKANNRTK